MSPHHPIMKMPSILLSITLLALPLLAEDGLHAPAQQADLLSPETQAQVQHVQDVLESAEMQKIAQRSPAIKIIMARDVAALKDAAAAQAEGASSQ